MKIIYVNNLKDKVQQGLSFPMEGDVQIGDPVRHDKLWSDLSNKEGRTITGILIEGWVIFAAISGETISTLEKEDPQIKLNRPLPNTVQIQRVEFECTLKEFTYIVIWTKQAVGWRVLVTKGVKTKVYMTVGHYPCEQNAAFYVNQFRIFMEAIDQLNKETNDKS